MGTAPPARGALSDLLAFTGLRATGRRTQAASPSGHRGRSPACSAHLSARLSRTPQVARGGEDPRPAPPRAATAIASPERLPGAQAGSRARQRRREPAGRDSAGEPGELCGAAACGARRAGAGRGARLRRALRNAPRSPGTLLAAGERSCPHLGVRSPEGAVGSCAGLPGNSGAGGHG